MQEKTGECWENNHLQVLKSCFVFLRVVNSMKLKFGTSDYKFWQIDTNRQNHRIKYSPKITNLQLSFVSIMNFIKKTFGIYYLVLLSLTPCWSVIDLGLDIQDDMGRHEVGFQDNTQKFEVNGGNGCRMESHFLINKVMIIDQASWL